MAAAPPGAGIGLRAPHYAELAARRPALALLEVHGENFFGDGGQALAWLERFRADYPLSIHGVGLSLGSLDALDPGHLARQAALVRRFQPALVSEHLCWSSFGGRHANDLLPLPFTEEALAHVCGRIEQWQAALGREVLVENVSSYLEYPESAMPEWEFLAEVARRTGCRLLLDVNNVWVNACNHGFDPRHYLDALAPEMVAQVHLAGFETTDDGLIDTHGRPVAAQVWALFADAIGRFGPRPTVIEWDSDIPPLDTLLAEAARAETLLAAALPRERVA
jgi:uncharacterized protein (UPF0276 family)